MRVLTDLLVDLLLLLGVIVLHVRVSVIERRLKK